MAQQIGEETKVTLDLKTIGMIVGFVLMIAGMWYTLQADIAEGYFAFPKLEGETLKLATPAVGSLLLLVTSNSILFT